MTQLSWDNIKAIMNIEEFQRITYEELAMIIMCEDATSTFTTILANLEKDKKHWYRLWKKNV